ncbi:ribosome silencing factor [Actibacterium sp. XHP0104]|uniref:ribosome silencing factor n=1 Tax=Actibacterium sp. XHP0104 TaxID=2984335 RepID=UPI0021E73CF4|nr:ribosome silencing factor [Actibacterium sp. XHP0104]MCV2881718.1 ribosome silencing factor [Actibacterium sp. XHP0104]
MPSAGVKSASYKEDNDLSQNANAASAQPAQGRPMTQPHDDVTSEVLLEHILASLNDDKAEDIVTIDLRGKSAMGDYMVICSGRSTRQVSAIAEKLADRIKADFGRHSKMEGKDQGDWVLIDTGDIIVHVFRPEVREFYQLEKMWLPSGATAPNS